MARNVTVTLSNGQVIQYNNVPSNITPEDVTARVQDEVGGDVDIVKIDGGSIPGEADAEPEITLGKGMENRRAFENDLRAYYATLKGAPVDESTIQGLAQKYNILPVANFPQIEEYYKKHGTLNPTLSSNALNAPAPTETPWSDVVTTVPKASDDTQDTRAIAKGALANFADEGEAALRMLMSGEIGVDQYYLIKDQINEDYDAWSKANYGRALAGEAAGSIGMTFVPFVGEVGKGVEAFTGLSKLAQGATRAAGSGALSGALSGLGEANTLSDAPKDVLFNAAVGAVTGPAAHKLFEGSARVANAGREAVLRRLGRSDGGVDAVDRAVAEILHGTSPAIERDIGATALSNRYGVPTTLGTSSPELAALTEKVLAKPSAGRDELASTIANTQREAGKRLEDQAERALPNASDYFDAEDAVTQRLRDIGDTEYKLAYQHGAVQDPDIEKIIYNPELASVWEKAQRLARLQGRQLQMKMEPVFDASGAVVGLKPTGDSIPDVEALDYFKRALDDKIDAGFRGTSGMGKGEASALRDLRKSLVQRLDTLVPEYAAARAKYAGDMEVRDALRLGRTLLSRKVRPQELEREIQNMSLAEREALKTGTLQSIFEPIEDTANNRNFAQQLRGVRGDSAKLQKLKLVMDPAEFKFFDRALKREGELFQRNSKIVGGSRTVPLAQGVASLDDMISGGNIDDAVNFILAGPQGKFASLARWVSKLNPRREFGDKVYSRLSKVLATNDRDELRDILSMLGKSRSYAEYINRAKELGSGRVAAATGLIAPATVEDRGVNIPPTAMSNDAAAQEQAAADAAQSAIDTPLPGEEEGVPAYGISEEGGVGAVDGNFPGNDTSSIGPQIEATVSQIVPGVVVTSRKRSPRHNAEVGGVSDSYHLTNDARDFVPPKGMTMHQLFLAVKREMPDFDVINEKDHVHVEPKKQAYADGGLVNDMNAGRARSVASGALFGFGDEAEAGLRAAANAATGRGWNYRDTVNHIRKEQEAYQEANPEESLVYEMGGTLLPSFVLPGGGTAAAEASLALRAGNVAARIAAKSPFLAKAANTAARYVAPISREITQGALYGAGVADDIRDIPRSIRDNIIQGMMMYGSLEGAGKANRWRVRRANRKNAERAGATIVKE